MGDHFVQISGGFLSRLLLFLGSPELVFLPFPLVDAASLPEDSEICWEVFKLSASVAMSLAELMSAGSVAVDISGFVVGGSSCVGVSTLSDEMFVAG